ncbi:MAG: winged helix-turn-helix domain-containing protein [Alphaproteobacteria bacterium]
MHNDSFKVLKMLSHKTRLDIIKLIKSNDGNLCYNDIVDQLKIPTMTINFHIKKLEECKIIFTKKAGPKFLLFINDKAIVQAKEDFNKI